LKYCQRAGSVTITLANKGTVEQRMPAGDAKTGLHSCSAPPEMAFSALLAASPPPLAAE